MLHFAKKCFAPKMRDLSSQILGFLLRICIICHCPIARQSGLFDAVLPYPSPP
jgi:hypothetical protein